MHSYIAYYISNSAYRVRCSLNGKKPTVSTASRRADRETATTSGTV